VNASVLLRYVYCLIQQESVASVASVSDVASVASVNDVSKLHVCFLNIFLRVYDTY